MCRLNADDDGVMAVFAKRAIARRTQFGPFIAEQKTDSSQLSQKSKKFPLQVINIFEDIKNFLLYVLLMEVVL